MGEGGEQMNTISYNADINACERDGEQMKTISYSADIRACEKGNVEDISVKVIELVQSVRNESVTWTEKMLDQYGFKADALALELLGAPIEIDEKGALRDLLELVKAAVKCMKENG